MITILLEPTNLYSNMKCKSNNSNFNLTSYKQAKERASRNQLNALIHTNFVYMNFNFKYQKATSDIVIQLNKPTNKRLRSLLTLTNKRLCSLLTSTNKRLSSLLTILTTNKRLSSLITTKGLSLITTKGLSLITTKGFVMSKIIKTFINNNKRLCSLITLTTNKRLRYV